MSLGFQDNVGNILGANTAANLYDSSSVTADADGSMIERQEYSQGLLEALTAGTAILKGTAAAGTNSTTIVALSALAGFTNDFFNDHFYLQVLVNFDSAGNAPESQVRKITDYVSSTGTFTCDAFSAAIGASDLCVILHESVVAIGRDDADNIIATTNVVANADGSVLERLEYIQSTLATIDDFVDGVEAVTNALPDAGALTALGANVQAVYDRVAGSDSVSNVLGANDADNGFDSSNVVANADGSVLERLEDLVVKVTAVDDLVDTEVAAIKTEVDKIGTISNAGGTATIGAALGAVANNTIVARLAAIQTEADKVGTISNAGGTATIGAALGAVANNTIVARLATITTETDQIGTMVNAGGAATVGGVFGDMANVTVAARLGLADGATTESIQGKLGTDTELADRSLYDILNGGGPAAAAAAAAPANDKSIYAVASAIYNLVVPTATTGETVIDEGDYDWTTAAGTALLTITPAAGAPLADVTIHLDMNKAATGFATVYAAQTISMYVERKIDGTNWRKETIVEAALSGTLSTGRDYQIDIGSVGVAQAVRIVAVMSAEVSGSAETHIPYVVYYKGLATPTITPLTATA